jgi:glycerophosphoryl diester phosphodiesterase
MHKSAIVIAHRGASGYLPEHTLAAKALAYGLGADFIEQDVVATRDAELVVLHDLFLDDVTDVARRFPGRSRGDGRHYVVDFDLAELRTLTVFERRLPGRSEAKFSQRFPADCGILGIATLREELHLIRGLNKAARRNVGIYPEIKEPQWHHRHGIDLAGLMIAELNAFGYLESADTAFVQCFDGRELRRVKDELGCALRLIQLVGTGADHVEMLTPAGLKTVASYAYGLGPAYAQLLDTRSGAPTATVLARGAHECGLRLHPYTFRRDDLPPYANSLEQLLEIFFREVEIDGVFCDHPDVAVRARNAFFGYPETMDSGRNLT